jgi:hypothetical protein
MLAAGALTAGAQVVPSAYGRALRIDAGGLASAFQPDYAGGGVASTSPNRLYGIGAYVDVKFSRWIQVEAEGRWLRYNQFLNIYQDNYLIGPRIPVHHYGRFTPYGKALFGFSNMNFEYNAAHGRFTTIAFGGGVDYRLTKKISIRCGDFEYQMWPSWLSSSLKPYGVSVGASYKVF